MTSEFIEFDLVMRSVVEIDAAPPIVWGGLDRVQQWKPSVASVERLQGSPGSIGEVLRLGQKAGDRIVYVIHKTLQLEPGVWRVQSLETEDGRSTRGYLVYSLHERGTGTLLVGELLARASLPADTLGGQSEDEAARMISTATRAKFHSDHLALKQWVESR
jgi:hypothetical protein